MRRFSYRLLRLVLVGVVAVYCVRALHHFAPVFSRNDFDLKSADPLAWALIIGPLILFSVIIDLTMRVIEEKLAHDPSSPGSQVISSMLITIIGGVAILVVEYNMFQSPPDPSPGSIVEQEIAQLYAMSTVVPATPAGLIEDVAGSFGRVPLEGSRLTNFIVDSRFVVPTGDAPHWSYGYQFRHNSRATYIIGLSSEGDWHAYVVETEGARRSQFQDVAYGTLASLDLSAGASNSLRLIVYFNQAFLYVNGVYVATIDVSQHIEQGELVLVSGLFGESAATDAPLWYENLTLRALPAN